MTILAMNSKNSFHITGWRRIVSVVIWSITIIALSIFIVRTAVWEHNYYAEKEGSERVVVESAPVEEEVVEEEKPTEQTVIEYTVAADRPRYLTIDKIGVSKSLIKSMGLKANGQLGTPSNIFDVGWYEASGKPGQGGTLLIDGHNGGPHVYGVFKKLPLLCARGDTTTRTESDTKSTRQCHGGSGDIITVERGDGVIYKYEVIENVAVSLDDADAYMATAQKSPIKGSESVTLITCSGEWSSSRKTYLSRQFV
ncbi:MAG: class F sortase, partial [Methanocorpusculum sp.]|nr:class F sortase [Methanocorpusculum sp.]